MYVHTCVIINIYSEPYISMVTVYRICISISVSISILSIVF